MLTADLGSEREVVGFKHFDTLFDNMFYTELPIDTEGLIKRLEFVSKLKDYA